MVVVVEGSVSSGILLILLRPPPIVPATLLVVDVEVTEMDPDVPRSAAKEALTLSACSAAESGLRCMRTSLVLWP